MKERKNINLQCNIAKCLGCRSCEVACAVEHSKSKDLFLSIIEQPLPRQRRSLEVIENPTIVGKATIVANASLSNACQHCDPAPCVEACMSGAMYKDSSGATLQNEKRCVGCWMCIMACPFGVITRQEKLALKCDLCPDRENEFACVEACPTGALCST